MARPVLAATAADEVTSAPLVAFGWSHDVLDPIFRFSSLGDDPGSGWVGGAASARREYNGTSWVATRAPGASVSASFWGSDIYWYGEPSSANLTLTVNGVEAPDKRENRLVAYTSGIPPLGYTNVTLTVNSGFVNLTMVNIRRYAYVANVPQNMYIGDIMLRGSWWDLPVSAWRAVEGGAANANFTTSGAWNVRSELASIALPHLVGSPGASLRFNVPPRTTYLQINGTATNTAARYTVSLSPDPLQGGPAMSTMTARAWPHVVEYFGLPLDPAQQYAVSVTTLEGDVGLQSILFIGDDYHARGDLVSTLPPGMNDGSGGGQTTSGSEASSGSSNGSGANPGGSPGSDGTSPSTGADPGNGGRRGGKPNIGAIVGGVLGGVALLVALALALWLLRKHKSKRSTIYSAFEVDDAAPKPQAFYRISSRRSSEKPHLHTRDDIALSPISAERAPTPLLARTEDPPPSISSPSEYHPLSSAGTTGPSTPVQSTQSHAVPSASTPPAPSHDPKLERPSAPRPRRVRETGPDELQETDAGRIVAVAPPRYDPAWRDE
ncbi:hypothetical protein CC85DRAFT_292985 [Cutaneotrichosporon oleaginosum]|uniref:Uncharacterized protein n=1 Tax=Cutaneotrichosporon oleaginosum TaxID=879819 RepID=A0A0J0XIG5_9TREE|nr:uncharacterized protein CC85DRAFT_292985 [Cutaneotrichosporon oleaginosum]KLT40873.1 hypothetical protein CC85DRAFT_292985 [Cutaneotrichosporon oleaginosum]TXT09267.1 hypothetical protein COLE_03201 [Cutaneotrichosporon oleaginosum]